MRKRSLGTIFFLFSFLTSFSQQDTVQKIIPGRFNSREQLNKPYVILISADGFRYDYATKHQANHLLKLSSNGVRAASMVPSYPSLTFPNHYTIVTGLYPSHHGLVNNYFYDPARKQEYSMRDRKIVEDGSWYGGLPLWVLAEQQQMVTASFYWVGSEADIQKTFPTYYYRYNDAISISRRIQIVLEWLQLPPEQRPHLITFYFPQVDHEGHHYGPDAPQTGESVRWVDSAIQLLADAVSATGLPVNYIFVSDHGMTTIDTVNLLPIPAIDTSRFVLPRGAELLPFYAKNKKDIMPFYRKLRKQEKGYKTYLKKNIPSYLHYGKKDDWMNRAGDIFMIPEWPHVFNLPDWTPGAGAHGFDPVRVRDMHAIFYAWGPAFRNVRVESFENVNVFPVITKILGLSYSHKIDGTTELAEKILHQDIKKN